MYAADCPAVNGTGTFYNGTIAASIVDAVQGHGGIMTKYDLAQYHAILKDVPSITYRNETIYSSAFGPPNVTR